MSTLAVMIFSNVCVCVCVCVCVFACVSQEFVVDTNSTYSAKIEEMLDESACGKLPAEFRKDWYLAH